MEHALLILGTLPPPVGGVTIHVERLLGFLDKNDMSYVFLSLRIPLRIVLYKSLSFRVIHLHCSNVYFRFFFSLFCFVCRKKLLVTYHGNLGRYNGLKNILDYLSVYFAYIPIVLNDESLCIALKINKKSELISSFIPPQSEECLPTSLLAQIGVLRSKYKLLCSTNVSAVSFDNMHNEIYGIIPLIKLFAFRTQDCLVVSDATGHYKDYVLSQEVQIPANVYFISTPHSYYALLKEVDCMIRNTTTDGDALSIKEALFLGKYVCATDVVDRHEAVSIYHTLDELNSLLDSYSERSPLKNLSGGNEILSIYKNLLCIGGKLI